MTTQRRRFLHLCGLAGLGALAGCSDDSGNSEAPTNAQESTTSVQSPVATLTPSDTTTATPSERTGETGATATQQAKISGDDPDDSSRFSSSIAVSSDGSIALVSDTNYVDGGGLQTGAVYVFEMSSESWSQQAILVPDDGGSGDRFGADVAASSDLTTVLISAPGHANFSGASYIFDSSGGSWSQQTKITPNNGATFGKSVAMSGEGNTGLIDTQPTEDKAGSVYVLDSSDGSWSQQTEISASDGEVGDQFGHQLDLSNNGEIALITANADENANGTYAGSAYVFEKDDESWTQRNKLTPDGGDNEDFFGQSVAMSSDGTTALIGAYADEDPNGEVAGSAYIFDITDESWTQQAKLFPDDGDSDDRFGASLGISSDGTTAVIGAYFDEDPNGDRAGSAYVFEAADGSWHQQAKLSASDGESYDVFGSSVGMSSDATTAVIGAEEDKVSGDKFRTGSAYVFKLQ